MSYKCPGLLSVCLILCASYSYSQTAGFTVSANSGCAGISISFTNTSTGFSSAAVYRFSFGDGVTVPLFPKTPHTYNTGNLYTATLTVTDNNTTYTQSKQITVYKKPTVDFSADLASVCIKKVVQFAASAAPGDGVIARYYWDFGDGTTLDTVTAKAGHSYINTHKVSVGLSVTNSYGCLSYITKSGIVTVLPAPKASFKPNLTTLCKESDSVMFANTTNGGATPTAYFWNFDDGTTSTAANPTHSYGVKGRFGVRLIATSSEGCADTTARTTITVASFKSAITLPSLLCLNSSLIFTDSSSPASGTPVWRLDNNVVAKNVHQYVTTFTDTNAHTLQLINNYGACADTALRMVQAHATPQPSPFTATINGGCNVPANVTFTDAGLGGIRWEWDVNNTDSTQFHPTAFTQSTSYTYKAENTYYIKLRVTDASGCTGDIRQPVIIKKNKLSILSKEGLYGCDTLTTTFAAASATPVARMRWTFSDDNSTSVLDTPQHTFLTKGTYTASVRIRTVNGCTDSASLNIRIADAPGGFTFTTPDTLICGNKTATFTVTGDSDKMIGNYYWNFGDAGKYTLLKGPFYTHNYQADSVYTVSLIINNHGCADTITKNRYVTVLPSFPKISSVVNDCGDRLKITFKEASTKAQNFSWDFGDHSNPHSYSILNRDSAIVHYYPKTGAYKVLLTTTNGNCISKDSIYAHTLVNQKPVLAAQQTALCENDSLLTTISGMEKSPFGYYSWIKDYRVKAIEYKDTSAFTGAYSYPDSIWKNPFHINIKGLNPGKKEVRIITISRNFNCLDTTSYIPVQVNGPTAAFSIADSAICLSDKLVVTDASKANGTSPIANWQWFFGDSTSHTRTTGGSATHQYTNPGNFNISLVVTDRQSCTDTAFYTSNRLTVKGPKAVFTVDQNPILPNTPELFTNLTDAGFGDNAYTWFFGDGTSAASGADSVYHTYKLYSDDTVSLIARSSQTGCSDTATSVVQVKNINLSFTYTSTFINQNSSCPPVMVKFKNTSVNFSIVSWNFGDGFSADNINTPSHTYYKPGVYKVIIYGYYNNNTYDSTWDYIRIAGPYASIHADALSGCGSQQVLFTAETLNATSLSWDFGDGATSPDSVVSHLYAKPDVYTPFITVKSGNQCSFSYSLDTSIIIDILYIKIKTDSMLQCHQMLAIFTPQLYSVAKNNGQHPDYKWDFGTGTDFSNQDTASFIYTKPGVYTVSLMAASPYGCKDTALVNITFRNTTAVSIQGPLEWCEGTPVQFNAVKANASDPLIYHWQFENDTSSLQNPAAQTFTSGNHSVWLAVNNNGCRDTAYQTITVYQRPKVTMLMSDTLVCLGTAITFDVKPANATDTLSYFWNLGTGKDSAAFKSAAFVYSRSGAYPVTLTATSNYGCTKQIKDTALVLSSPKVSIQAPTDICIGGPAAFSASSTVSFTRYQWHFPDGSTDTSQHSASKFYNQPAANDVYLVGSIGNCYDTAYHTLTVHDYPAVNLTVQKVNICFGDSVQLTAHNGAFYDWIVAPDTLHTTLAALVLSPKINTQYKVAVTDTYGCKNVDSVAVFVVMPQQIQAAPIVNACEGSRVNLSASGTDKYKWINGDNLNSFTIANPVTLDSAQHKIYAVVGSDKYGCFTDTAHIEVMVRKKPIVDAVHNIVGAAGVPVQLSATSTGNIVKWNWQPPAYLSCNNCAMPVSKLRHSTRFTVEATDDYGCKGSDTVLVTLTCQGSRISVPEAFSPNGDGQNDRLRVAVSGIKTITHFVIYERNGNKVWERNNISPLDNNASWDGTYKNILMPNGTYVYMIEATCNAGEIYSLQGTITLIR